jgi:hydroxymethylbilane synthase
MSSAQRQVIRIATRASPLAMAQSQRVADRLATALGLDPQAAPQLVIVDTFGDRTQKLGTPLHQIGGQGVFVKEVQAAVLDGRADLAVHSAKDLPTATTAGLVIGAISERGDVRDALIGSTLRELRDGAVVASGSVRRRAQLAHLRPDLRFIELRGNMATRAAKALEPDIDAVVIGATGLDRIDLGHLVDEHLDPVHVCVPQIAQAAVAIECRVDDEDVRAAVAAIDDHDAHLAVLAERAFLSQLGSGCTLPVGAWCRRLAASWELIALVASLDGSDVVRLTADRSELTIASAISFGADAGRDILDAGAADLLRRAGLG